MTDQNTRLGIAMMITNPTIAAEQDRAIGSLRLLRRPNPLRISAPNIIMTSISPGKPSSTVALV